MKANAIVTIARYGPLTRSAGSASSAPTAPASTPGERETRARNSTPLHGQDRDGVGPDRIEADMAERYLARQPEQDVESDADHGGERHQRQDEVRSSLRSS